MPEVIDCESRQRRNRRDILGTKVAIFYGTIYIEEWGNARDNHRLQTM
jgi:hypothetical protein